MKAISDVFSVPTQGKGTYEITDEVASIVRGSGVNNGLATVFVRHTSCSLIVMENADPSAREDLHAYFDRLVPEDEPYFVHTCEGPDDMPSHIRMVLTDVDKNVPIVDGQLVLGTWQGIFFCEFDGPRTRKVHIQLMPGAFREPSMA